MASPSSHNVSARGASPDSEIARPSQDRSIPPTEEVRPYFRSPLSPSCMATLSANRPPHTEQKKAFPGLEASNAFSKHEKCTKPRVPRQAQQEINASPSDPSRQ